MLERRLLVGRDAGACKSVRVIADGRRSPESRKKRRRGEARGHGAFFIFSSFTTSTPTGGSLTLQQMRWRRGGERRVRRRRREKQASQQKRGRLPRGGSSPGSAYGSALPRRPLGVYLPWLRTICWCRCRQAKRQVHRRSFLWVKFNGWDCVNCGGKQRRLNWLDDLFIINSKPTSLIEYIYYYRYYWVCILFRKRNKNFLWIIRENLLLSRSGHKSLWHIRKSLIGRVVLLVQYKVLINILNVPRPPLSLCFFVF